MKIVTYDQIDPVQALDLSMLALDFSLTPERAAHIRQTDPRPFPCLALYALDGDKAVGQVGVFRLPMVTIHGREDVGGVWAVSTHPEYAGRGVASLLLEAAHTQMLAAGLRFSTLGADRFRVSHRLYRRHGYEDMRVWASALARWETAHQPTRLRAKNPSANGYDLVEALFEEIAQGRLGFAWRHTPFARLRDQVPPEDIWVFWENMRPAGYAFARRRENLLVVSDLALLPGVDAAEALAALTACLDAAYVQASLSRPADIASLRSAGYRVAHPNWAAFMVKPLQPGAPADEARRIFGIGTDRFMISWLDTT